MGFSEAVSTCLTRYATFSGRARRPEYWWFILFVVLGSIVGGLIDLVLFGAGTEAEPATAVVGPLFQLATLVPILAAGWRRMHDTGRSGWYLLLPTAVSLLGLVALSLGWVGVTELEQGTVNAETLETVGQGYGLAVLGLVALVQLVLAVLVIWWLTRPSQPGSNAFGPEPAA